MGVQRGIGSASASMDRRTFDEFRRIIYERSGIKLGDGKDALVIARVGKRMRALGIEDHRQYLKYVKNDPTGEEMVKLLDAISTNVTSFFREREHFAFLRDAVGEWVRGGQQRFRIWSAACSTGEEPYSLAMSLLEAVGKAVVDVRVLATDISTGALEHASAGEYREERMEPVSPQLRARYFERLRRGDEVVYRVKPALANIVVFRRLNLSCPPFPMRGPLDVIFCRNVMIYFDRELRQRLLGEAHRLLRPRGYLMIGHAESLTGMSSGFCSLRPSIYMRLEEKGGR